MKQYERVLTILKPSPPAKVLVHEFCLRPDFRVRVALPSDITNNELDRLSRAVMTFGFEE